MKTPETARPSSRRTFNDGRLRLFATTPGRLIAFVCECDSPDCTMTVRLTPEQYAERRGAPILAHP